MPSPQMIIAALLAMLLSTAGGFFAGYDWAKTKADAQLARDMEAQQIILDRQRARADELSSSLSIAEGRVITQTVEVIKHVQKVTTGAPCLNSATVSLLQPGANSGLNPPASALAPEGAAPASSDTDIAYWIASANQHYETCALRLNSLIDFNLSTLMDKK